MISRNQITLVGRIGDAIKDGKTKNGTSYIYFALEVYQNMDTTQNNQYQTLHVMVFKKKVVDYLKRIKAHSGNICIVFGFISSFKYIANGKETIANGVNGNEVYIVKTK